MMHISQKILHNIEKASATDTITLDYEGRFLRSKRLISDLQYFKHIFLIQNI